MRCADRWYPLPEVGSVINEDRLRALIDLGSIDIEIVGRPDNGSPS